MEETLDLPFDRLLMMMMMMMIMIIYIYIYIYIYTHIPILYLEEVLLTQYV